MSLGDRRATRVTYSFHGASNATCRQMSRKPNWFLLGRHGQALVKEEDGPDSGAHPPGSITCEIGDCFFIYFLLCCWPPDVPLVILAVPGSTFKSSPCVCCTFTFRWADTRRYVFWASAARHAREKRGVPVPAERGLTAAGPFLDLAFLNLLAYASVTGRTLNFSLGQ